MRYAAAAQALIDDPNVDGVLAILTPQAMSYPTETARALVEVAATHPCKPLLTSFMGEIKVRDGLEVLRSAHVPTFDTPEDAVKAYMDMYQYTKSLKTLYETPADILPDFDPDRDKVKAIFLEVARGRRDDAQRDRGQGRARGLRHPGRRRRCSRPAPRSAPRPPSAIGFPVAIKIYSHDITHKTDVGGIALNVRSAPEAAQAVRQDHRARPRIAAPKAKLLGVTVQADGRAAATR